MVKRKAAGYALRAGYKRRRVIRRAARITGRGLGIAMRSRARYGLAAAGLGLAAYGLRRAYKSRRKANVRVMGSKHTSSTQNRSYVYGGGTSETAMDAKQMYIEEVKMTLPAGSGASELHKQDGAGYFLKGFKLCGTVRNGLNVPVEVNFMLAQFKDDTENAVAEWWENFFVNADPAVEERHRNFINRIQITDPTTGLAVGGAPTAIWDATQMCSRLNPDKFNVIKHAKFQLEGRNDTGLYGSLLTKTGSGHNYVKFDEWYQVNKKFVLEKSTNASPVRPIYAMMWYETVFPRAIGDGNDGILVNMNCHAYTKSIK